MFTGEWVAAGVMSVSSRRKFLISALPQTLNQPPCLVDFGTTMFILLPKPNVQNVLAAAAWGFHHPAAKKSLNADRNTLRKHPSINVMGCYLKVGQDQTKIQNVYHDF